MMLSITQDQALHTTLDEIGLGTAIREGGSVLIKVNLARLPEPGHPRTDPALLAHVVRYVARCEDGIRRVTRDDGAGGERGHGSV